MCIFFFFKQKTAYEMRISDWSSDVCSSDLRRCDDRMRPIAEVRRGHHPVQGQLERAGRVGQKVGDAAQRLVFARVEDMQDGPDQQRVRGLFPMVALLQRSFGIDQNVRDVLHVAHFMRAARSEEHTSELQSLMRISYAVFCLKKKNKHKIKKCQGH